VKNAKTDESKQIKVEKNLLDEPSTDNKINFTSWYHLRASERFDFFKRLPHTLALVLILFLLFLLLFILIIIRLLNYNN
jgi:hypothetical protein